MSRNDNSKVSHGVGFAELLTLAFVVLKLCGVINWSWWWVLSPIWITVGLSLIVIGIGFVLAR